MKHFNGFIGFLTVFEFTLFLLCELYFWIVCQSPILYIWTVFFLSDPHSKSSYTVKPCLNHNFSPASITKLFCQNLLRNMFPRTIKKKAFIKYF